MPTLVKELDQSKVYAYCPNCRANGNPSVPLSRDMHVMRCPFGHQISGEQLIQSGADMVKSGEIFPEQPTITDIKWSIWVNPKVKERLEQKFAGRIMITVATLLAALSDDALVMITGEQAAKLRAEGIKSGAEMLSAVEMSKETARNLVEANSQIEKFMGMLRQVQIPGAQ